MFASVRPVGVPKRGGMLYLTSKFIRLLMTPFTVTVTGPIIAPVGTVATMDVAVHLEDIAGVSLKAAVLLPSISPKFLLAIVTESPIVPEATDRLLAAASRRRSGLTPHTGDLASGR